MLAVVAASPVRVPAHEESKEPVIVAVPSVHPAKVNSVESPVSVVPEPSSTTKVTVYVPLIPISVTSKAVLSVITEVYVVPLISVHVHVYPEAEGVTLEVL